MKRKIKEELVRLSQKIIDSTEIQDYTALYEEAKNLYEKLAVLRFIDEKLNDIEVDVSKNVLAARFETMASAVLRENTSVPENNPHQEDIITPGMDTIKGMVSEMPNEALEYIFSDFLTKGDFIKKENEAFSSDSNVATINKSQSRKLYIDLNDRLAFVKNLFHDDLGHYEEVIDKLNASTSEKDAVAYLESQVKPTYNNWIGKEEFELRLKNTISRRFS